MINRLIYGVAVGALLSIGGPLAWAGDTPVDSATQPFTTQIPGVSADVPVLGEIETSPERPLDSFVNRTSTSLLSLTLGVQAETVYNSNIYRSFTDEEGDLIAIVSPKIKLKSALDRHAAEFSLSPEIGRYLSESKNNYVDWNVGAKGRFDVSLSDAIHIGAVYKKDHVAIGGFDDDTGAVLAEPVDYDFFDASALWKGFKNFLHYEAGAGLESYDYENAKRENGLISIQDDRDHDRYKAVAKLGYEFLPPYVMYVGGGWNERRYDEQIDISAIIPRDSKGYNVKVGIARDVKDEPYSFDAYIGYLNQNYDANQLEDVGDVDFGVDARLKLTQSDQVKFKVSRDVREIQSSGVSSSLRTKLGAGYDHDYTPTFSTGVNLGYTNDDYQSNTTLSAIDREDDTYDAGINARYKIYQDVSLELAYTYRNRNSNVTTADYDAHSIGLTLSAKY
ncbi:MAG: outer membrane beta-barrel protein [Alphaproteobacteria bacterium]|nr:outer membrane beta-barrel protein [Alphaproteobacteria bacterium]